MSRQSDIEMCFRAVIAEDGVHGVINAAKVVRRAYDLGRIRGLQDAGKIITWGERNDMMAKARRLLKRWKAGA